MAISSSYYINAPSLGSATAVFTDSSLLTCAADGFYSDGIISREQVGCVLLPQQTCPSCYTAYELGYSELSCEEACSSTPVTYYSGCDELVLYYCYLWTDPELTIEAPAGYYSDGINCYDYRFPHSGIISITPCCTTPTLYLASTSSDACNQINGQLLTNISHTDSFVCPYCDWTTLNSTEIPSLPNGTYYVSDGTAVRVWTKSSTPSNLYNPTPCSSCSGALINYEIRLYNTACELLGTTVIFNGFYTPLNINQYYPTDGLILPGNIVEVITLTATASSYSTSIIGPSYLNCPDVP